MVENYIIMLGIKKGNNNIWKKYYLQSFYHTYKQLNELPILKKAFSLFKKEYNMPNASLRSINFNYGWLSTKNKKIRTFKDACRLLDPSAYDDFIYLSNSSHSNSLIDKLLSEYFSIPRCISIHQIYLIKVINLLNLEVSDKCYNLSNKISDYIDNYCEELEKYKSN